MTDTFHKFGAGHYEFHLRDAQDACKDYPVFEYGHEFNTGIDFFKPTKNVPIIDTETASSAASSNDMVTEDTIQKSKDIADEVFLYSAEDPLDTT